MPSGKKLTYEFVKSQFEKLRCILVSTKYVNSKTKLDYICDKGHKHSMTWNDWQQGVGCSHCSGKAIKTIEGVKESFEKESYTVLDKEYINSKTKINYTCPQLHKHSTTWEDWRKGNRCPYCAGNIKKDLVIIKEIVYSENYVILDNYYINALSPMTIKCPNNHKYKVSWNSWSAGNRCPKCIDHGTSKFEQQVKDFTLSLGQKIIENDRTLILNPNTARCLELDILFYCKTKAIECNGVYWHSLQKSIEKDKIKNKQCKEKGINLLTITDEIWYNDREKCEKIIKDFIDE